MIAKIYKKLLIYLFIKDQYNREFMYINKIHKFYDKFSYIFLKRLYKKFNKNLLIDVLIDNQEYIWLLIQHCDNDTILQLKYLDLFVKHNINPKYIALLTDRIGINRNNIQLYGTQLYEIDNTFYLYPIDNIQLNVLTPYELNELNKLRHSMNLSDIEYDMSKLSEFLGIFMTFRIYNKTLFLDEIITTKDNHRKVRDISDYRYFKIKE